MGSHLGGYLSGNRSQRTARKSPGLKILLTWFQIPSSATWTWVCHFCALRLSFLICKMEHQLLPCRTAWDMNTGISPDPCILWGSPRLPIPHSLHTDLKLLSTLVLTKLTSPHVSDPCPASSKGTSLHHLMEPTTGTTKCRLWGPTWDLGGPRDPLPTSLWDLEHSANWELVVPESHTSFLPSETRTLFVLVG